MSTGARAPPPPRLQYPSLQPHSHKRAKLASALSKLEEAGFEVEAGEHSMLFELNERLAGCAELRLCFECSVVRCALSVVLCVVCYVLYAVACAGVCVCLPVRSVSVGSAWV